MLFHHMQSCDLSIFNSLEPSNLNHHRHAIAFDAMALLVGGDDPELQGLASGLVA